VIRRVKKTGQRWFLRFLPEYRDRLPQ
jgi:hypothetical protein